MMNRKMRRAGVIPHGDAESRKMTAHLRFDAGAVEGAFPRSPSSWDKIIRDYEAQLSRHSLFRQETVVRENDFDTIAVSLALEGASATAVKKHLEKMNVAAVPR